MAEDNHSRFAGMTSNERLYEVGLLDEWEAAAKLRDRARRLAVLAKVDLADQASDIADAVLRDPKRYGF
jgi:hypothetical protein